MSEVLTINTEDSVIKKDRVEPLPLYNEDFSMLSDEIPEYTDPLPNPIMTNLVNRLKLTMKLYGGIGLSANQCGVYERLFVIGSEDYQMTCINPKVIAVSEELEKSEEGCLSFPALKLSIKRPVWADVEYTDENGKLNQIRLTGLTARCFLHELDHMNGVKFTDHVGAVSIQTAKRKQLKLLKKVQRQAKNKNGFSLGRMI
jgi:peptide deformylase